MPKPKKLKPTPLTRGQLDTMVNNALASGKFAKQLKANPKKILQQLGVKNPAAALVRQIKSIRLQPFKPAKAKDPAC